MTSIISSFFHVVKIDKLSLSNFLKIKFISLIHAYHSCVNCTDVCICKYNLLLLLPFQSFYYPQSLAKHCVRCEIMELPATEKTIALLLQTESLLFLFSHWMVSLFPINFLNSFSLSWFVIHFIVLYPYVMFSL